MDALSNVLDNIHLEKSFYSFIHGCGEDWAYQYHCQDKILLYVVLKGEFCIEVDDVTLNRRGCPGDIIMMPRAPHHTAHAIAAEYETVPDMTEVFVQQQDRLVTIGEGDKTASMILISCEYDKKLAEPLLRSLPEVLPKHEELSQHHLSLLKMGSKVLEVESRNQRIGKDTMIDRLCSMLMVECLRTHIENLDCDADNWLLALKDPFLSKAMTAMHNEPEYHWTIHHLAEIAGLSRSSFAERFREVVGQPPLTYLIDYRLRLAARHLREHQYSINRIGDLVGYASDSTFSQAFKRVYGISPRTYRQQYVQ